MSDRTNDASVHLIVDPDSWWMSTGNVTSLVATWIGPAPGCSLSADWFRWSITGGSAGGTLAPWVGERVNFTAASTATGPTNIVVRSAAVLTCGSNESSVLATAEANVTVVAPISIQNLSVSPNPVDVAGTAWLSGNLTGGEPPYDLRIEWGDGTVTTGRANQSGSISFPHHFPGGRYSPSLEVTDSAGLLSRATVSENLTSSASLAVGIVAGHYVTDAGIPTRFTATILDAPEHFGTVWSCGDTRSKAAPTTNVSTVLWCTFSTPGPAPVSFEVEPLAPEGSASATLSERVVPDPSLTVRTVNLTAEVGQSFLEDFRVTGGVPPYFLEWGETGAPVHGRLNLTADGEILLPIDPANAGSIEVVTRLVDGEGFITSNVTSQLQVDPALNDSLSSGRSVTTTGERIGVTTTITAGAPPFLWLIVPDLTPSNESAPAGTLGAVGWFGWSATSRCEGTTELTVIVVDAAGAVATSTLELEAVSPLGGTALVTAPGPATPGVVSLAVELFGGLPPFQVTVRAGDGEQWNRTASSDGNSSWTLSVQGRGVLDFRLVITDALDAELTWNGTASVIAPPMTPLSPRAGSSETGEQVVGGIAVLACVGLGLLLYRRRGRMPPSPAPLDPVAVLRGIIAPADGADRATVELLAEEAGIPLETVRSTIDRLVAQGTIRSDSSADEGEVVSWTTDAPL